MGRSFATHVFPCERNFALATSSLTSISSRFTLRPATVCALVLLTFAAGCHRRRKTTSAPNTTQYANNIQAVVEKKQLPGLRWPDYSDYQPAVTTFYDDRNNEIAWLRDLKPTPATTGFLQAFQDAGAKGLNPEDYDASRWPARLQQIAQIAAAHDNSTTAQNTVAQFDTYMTVCVMRYISDLRIGRVNPQHFNFDITTSPTKNTTSPSSSPTTQSTPLTSPSSSAPSNPIPTSTAPPRPPSPTTSHSRNSRPPPLLLHSPPSPNQASHPAVPIPPPASSSPASSSKATHPATIPTTPPRRRSRKPRRPPNRNNPSPTPSPAPRPGSRPTPSAPPPRLGKRPDASSIAPARKQQTQP
jgi:hypothetical protein